MGCGPLGSDANCPVSDPGTNVRGPSPSQGPVCLEGDPNNLGPVQLYQKNVNYLQGRASAARQEMQSYLYALPAEEQKRAQEDINQLNVYEKIVMNYLGHLLDGSLRDTKDFDLAIDKFGKAVVAVELGNEKYKTARDFGRIELALELATVLVRGTERVKAAAQALPGDLQDLKTKLEDAKKDVKGADWQMAINGLLFLTTKLLEGAVPPIGALEIFLRAGAFTAAVMENDRLLGPSSSRWADLDVAAGSLIEALPDGVTKLSESTKKFFGKASALGTLAFDVHEILEAKEIVEKLKKKVDHVKRELESIEGWLRINLSKLPRLRLAIAELIKAREAAAANAASADQTYRQHKSAPDQPGY